MSTSFEAAGSPVRAARATLSADGSRWIYSLVAIAVTGIEAGIRAFNSEEALRVYADRLDADYIVLCRYVGEKNEGAERRLAAGLHDGSIVPAWLERIPLDTGPLAVWRRRAVQAHRPNA